MANKNNKQDIDVRRANRIKKKRRKKAKKFFITAFSLIVVCISVFLITIKVMKPDFDFSKLISQSISGFIENEIKNNESDEKTSSTSTPISTTKPMLNYIEAESFKFNTSKQGNYLGNLLGGGKVGTDLTYIYYIVDGRGIYRFNPNTEDYALFYSSPDTLGSINLRGDYIYFVNETSNELCKLQKGKKEARVAAENVRFAYVYDSNVYFVKTDNSLCTMDVKALTPVTVYRPEDGELNFVGISLERVFFTVTDSNGTVDYLTIDSYGHRSCSYFMESTYPGEIVSMQIENGFMYYYQLQDNGTYNLCRQKYGSEKNITLLENTAVTQYVIIDSNRLYYSELDDNVFRMKELNMNSDDRKTLLKVSGADRNNLPSIQHGWEYDFIIGAGEYSASCIYTSSTNVMSLNDNKNWEY